MHESLPADEAVSPHRPWSALRRRCTLDVRSLAVFRIALGLLLVADAALRSRDVPLMFAADGIFPPRLIRGFFAADPTQWSLALLRDETWWGAAVLGLEGVAGACLAVGWRTAAATAVAWVAQVSVYRRTIPAANAGDMLLSCLLLWSCFLPLGAVWSLDARRRDARAGRPQAAGVCGPATAALLFQVMAVYVGAGLAKWNASWLDGTALRYALSVHDHGTPLGMRLAAADWLMPPLTWGVLGGEIVAPLVFIAWPAARPLIALGFVLLHVAIWLTMSVGLFAPIGIAAWLPLLPGSLWPGSASRLAATVSADCSSRLARAACIVLAALAAVAFLHDRTAWRERPLPAPMRQAIQAASLAQPWSMFDTVPPLEQWAYGRAELADGRVVDLLRGGRPLETERPAGGFTSLPHHRWHKLLWILPRPRVRPFAPSVAAALARDWNARHDADAQVVSLEIRFAQRNLAASDAPLHDMLVGAWPDRDAAGTGNLDRLLDARSDAAGRDRPSEP
jgi:hypothetical protein